ncbi:ANL family adenylate-forming protein [Halarcobacter sp.]|uniref:ANL family adenylate-forming protein n=1 Tax=Halarcobacter sp. TaxID=2321133 RepID=UPI003AFF6901
MNWLIEKFQKFDTKNSIVFENKEYKYDQLLNQVNIYCNEIKNKIKPNEVVAILSDYSFNSIALLITLYLNKNIIVPITTKIQEEIDDRLEESFCDKVIDLNEESLNIKSYQLREKHEMLLDLNNKRHAGLILFSSGSTGKPKAMIHDLDNLIDSYKEKREKSMNMLVFLMFDHIGGLNTLFNALSMGATLIIPKNRDAEDICQLIEDYKIRILPSSPTFLNLILISEAYKKFDLKSLRMITYGTEAMPDSLLLRLKETFPKVKLLQTFGTSETGIAGTSSKSSNSTYMKLDDPNLEYKIVENELWLKSKTQVLGYLNASMDSFTKDGWFKTGDLVETTEDGYLKIIGRSKEVINVGGEKVLPAEVESILLEIEEIEDCMVYSEANTITGQTVVCDIVLNKSEITAKEAKKLIRKYAKEKIESYKIPTKVNLVEKTNFSDRFKKIRSK